ncbi:hypothetical protein BBO99_00006645 [Phytophthora kernoviae]|uniref:Transmembrane protein n=2 Tax=Phytophthora kernoviae TaxID=325452 RepID=A0A3R7KS62_9STRA|nr:hypothetical protein G195_007253 [Phytophthora kernoviae 00238/432]KAG2522551.1 hypothetical protein JM18_006039 [Phytophthora kernoviae]RLN14905.1 hypothetical protein BBI17_006649 [Phytophthora kernoviae]RLN77567.1 hypothetical protein BBO99_00006645 [Phytophthora kernoviae]
MLFEHIRNRADDETKEVATARQRKEKVLLFRKPWFRRHRQGDIQGSPQIMDQSVLTNEASTLDTTQSTTEERWFVWLTRFEAATFQMCGVLLFFGGCALATLLGLLRLGYNNSLYGVPLDEDVPELLGLAFGLVIVALIAALANDLREQQLKRSHRLKLTPVIVALVVVAIAALFALGAVLLTIFMMHEVVQEDASALTNWSVRITGFSVAERLETAWKEKLTGYFKNTVQQELRCCGFLGPTDAPYLPCPDGDPVQITYQALSVSGIVVDKTQAEFTALPGCRSKMLTRFQQGADVATYCAIAMAGLLFLMAVSAFFLARELAISKDSKLKLRVPDPTADAEEVKRDIRETFETVVGLKIAAPTRGKLRSQLLASSLESVAPTVASELAAAPLKHEQVLIASTPSAHENLADGDILDGNHDMGQKGETTAGVSTVGADDTTNVPYPASIVYVVFTICLLWLVVMAYVVAISAMELGLATSWRCVLAWAVGVATQELVVEPTVIFASIVARTVKDWWSRTLIARLIRYGRTALRIDPQNARSLEHEHLAKSLNLYDRLRYAAAVRIQHRLITRVTRARYLRQLRAHKQKLHRTLEAQRRETLRKTLSNFSDEEVEAFRLLFVSADAAQLGLVSHTAIAQAVYELGVHVPAPTVRELLEAFDPAYADLVDFEHFLYDEEKVAVKIAPAMVSVDHRGEHAGEKEAPSIDVQHSSSSSGEFNEEFAEAEVLVEPAMTVEDEAAAAAAAAAAAPPKPESTPSATETKPFGAYLLLTKQVPPLQANKPKAVGAQSALEKALLKKKQKSKTSFLSQGVLRNLLNRASLCFFFSLVLFQTLFWIDIANPKISRRSRRIWITFVLSNGLFYAIILGLSVLHLAKVTKAEHTRTKLDKSTLWTGVLPVLFIALGSFVSSLGLVYSTWKMRRRVERVLRPSGNGLRRRVDERVEKKLTRALRFTIVVMGVCAVLFLLRTIMYIQRPFSHQGCGDIHSPDVCVVVGTDITVPYASKPQLQ